jgi:hypothetical protein
MAGKSNDENPLCLVERERERERGGGERERERERLVMFKSNLKFKEPGEFEEWEHVLLPELKLRS